MKDSIRSIKSKARRVLSKHGVVKAGLFGSWARGEAKQGSDVDILVRFKSGKSLLDLAGAEMDLESVLKKKVDLLTYNSLNPLLREKVLAEEVRII